MMGNGFSEYGWLVLGSLLTDKICVRATLKILLGAR